MRLPGGISACLFDLDGVITQTAVVHAAAWKQAFDDLLARRSARTGEPLVPFDAVADYDRYVDGRPRLDGTRGFLRARGIDLAEGTTDDAAGAETVHGVARAKDERLVSMIEERGVEVYPGSARFVAEVRRAGLATALVSSSAHTHDVLRATGFEGSFDVVVDALVAGEEQLAGKPAPDTYLAAARHLGVAPGAAAVFEDALSGVEAGHAGGFGLVVGVDRTGQAEALAAHGADVVVADLSELIA